MIKAIYKADTNIVFQYFEAEADLSGYTVDEENKTIDGDPYIEVGQEEWAMFRSRPCKVIDGKYQRYVADKRLEDLKAKGMKNRNNYLNSKGWYAERLVMTTAAGSPVEIPQDVLTKCQTARDEFSAIRDASTFEEVSNINIDFE